MCFRSYSSRRRIILFQVILKRKKTYYYMCQVNYTFYHEEMSMLALVIQTIRNVATPWTSHLEAWLLMP